MIRREVGGQVELSDEISQGMCERPSRRCVVILAVRRGSSSEILGFHRRLNPYARTIRQRCRVVEHDFSVDYFPERDHLDT